MDSFDSRVAHSSEASTDELASCPNPAEAPASPAPAPQTRAEADLFVAFATAAEQEAYWMGVRAGAKAAREGTALPPGRHRPPDADLELTRDSASAGLVSARLTEPGTAEAPRAARHDGWNAARERIFLETLAATGVVADACRACGMSRDAAYNRRNSASGRAFALGWEAALVLSRAVAADDVMSRARHGVIDRIYRNGELVAERHRHDNRLAMAVLTRLDRLVAELGERAPAVRAAAEEFDQFLDRLPQGNKAAEAFLARRLGERPLEPPHVQNSDYDADDERNMLARAAHYERHGAGLPAEIDIDDLDPAGMEGWSDDQLERAEGSGLLASLSEADWPDCAHDGEADGTDGMCNLRKLYLRVTGMEWDTFSDE
jgi:hypothetical protein